MAKTKNKAPKAPKHPADEQETAKKAAEEAAAKESPEKEAAEKAAVDEAAKKGAGKKINITEEQEQKYPPAFVSGLKKAGYKEKDVMRMKSYDPLEIYRAVFTNGGRHEFSYDGDWLTKPKPKKEEKKAEKE